MSRRIVIFDTSVLCCFLQVPGKETAGVRPDHWDYSRINEFIEKEKLKRSTFVLPLASLIETGNHIAQSRGDRYSVAVALAKMISDTANTNTPWAAFTDQPELWSNKQLIALSETWPNLAKGGISIGDATIKDVAEYYARAGFDVEIVTGDLGLKSYEPTSTPPTPRRRR